MKRLDGSDSDGFSESASTACAARSGAVHPEPSDDPVEPAEVSGSDQDGTEEQPGFCLTGGEWHRGGIVSALHISADARLLVSAGNRDPWTRIICRPLSGNDALLRVWALTGDGPVEAVTISLEPEITAVSCARLSPDGSRLAACIRDDGTVRTFDTTSGELCHKWEERFPRRTLQVNNCLAFSPDGERIATICDTRRVLVWRTTDGETFHDLDSGNDDGHGEVWTVSFSPDGTRIATGATRVMKLWDASSGVLLRTIPDLAGGVWATEFSTDGMHIACTEQSVVFKVWDLKGNDPPRVFRGHSGEVNGVAFSPTEPSRIASGSEDKTVRIWDATGYVLRIFAHKERVFPVLWTPDGMQVLSGDGRGDVMFWDARCVLDDLTAFSDTVETLHKRFALELKAGLATAKQTHKQVVKMLQEASRLEELKTLNSSILPSLLQLPPVSVKRAANTTMVKLSVESVMDAHITKCVIALDGIVLLLLLLSCMRAGWLLQHDGGLTAEDLRVLSLMLVFAAYEMLRELGQARVMIRNGLGVPYLCDTWTMVDWAAIGSVVAVAIIGLHHSASRTTPAFRIVSGTAALFLWMKLLGYIKNLSMPLATFVLSLSEILMTLRWFLFVLAVIMSAFATAFFFVLNPRQDVASDDGDARAAFATAGESLLSVYRMMMGDFDREWFATPDDEETRAYAVALFVAYVFVVTILLLNILIALVSDGYENAQDRALYLYNTTRLELAAEMCPILAACGGGERAPMDSFAYFISSGWFGVSARDMFLMDFILHRAAIGICIEKVVESVPKGVARTAVYGVAFVFIFLLFPVFILDLCAFALGELGKHHSGSVGHEESTTGDHDSMNEWLGRTQEIERRVHWMLQQTESRLNASAAARQAQIEARLEARVQKLQDTMSALVSTKMESSTARGGTDTPESIN